MGRSKGERAIRRAEKHKDKEKIKRIEMANRMLIPVPKATRESLGLISFDPNGTLRFKGNRWVRVYEICESNEVDKDVSLSQVAGKLHSKMKITKKVVKGVLAPRETDGFVTLMVSGETYDEVRSIYADDEEALKGQISLKCLTVDEIFSIITKQSGENDFSYASMVRGKKDWMKLFPKVAEEHNYFLLNGAYGECCFSLKFPECLLADVTEKLKVLGCPIVVSLSLIPIDVEDNLDFTRSIEKRYNRRLTSGTTTTEYFNASLELLFICDSADAGKIIEQTIFSVFSKEGFILSPSIGMQKEAARGILSLGLVEHSNMRNVPAVVIDQMGLLGGQHGSN